MVKKILKYVLVFVVSVVVLFLVMVGSEFISQDAMRDQVESSIGVLCEKDAVFTYWKGMPAGNMDRYADSVSLGIAWQSDSEHPFEAAMWCSYYVDRFFVTRYHHANYDLRRAFVQNLEGNNEYLRYWHGNVPVIRFFHLFTNIRGMYIILGLVMAALFLSLLVLLWRYGLKSVAIGFIISGFMVSLWFVPFVLEYVWMFLVAFSASIIALIWGRKDKWNRMGALFLVTGIVANYLDFLTTETITFLLPLLILVALRSKSESKAPILPVVRDCVLWGIGYLGMWIMKWVIASAILGINVMPYVTKNIALRLGTSQMEEGNILSTLGRNLIGLIPTTFGKIGIIVSVFLFLAWLCVIIVYKKSGIRKDYVILYIALGMIPFIRYVVMTEHSFVHFTFTYRALMASILSMCLITCEVFDFSVFRRKAYG